MTSDASRWVWMPHAGHLIVGQWCQFHVATYLGNGFLVSTVGEYVPDSQVREILAQCRGITLEGRGDARLADWMRQVGYEDIGCNRKYETMVFKAVHHDEASTCCPWRQSDGIELDAGGDNDPGAAMARHLTMCRTWAAKHTEDT